MTRILLTIAIVFSFSLVASAQFKKNDFLIGGQLSYSYNSSSSDLPSGYYPGSDQKMNNGNITISLGKALNETTVGGINLSYLPSSSTNNVYNSNPLYSKNNGYAAGVFFRKYKNLGKDFFLFGQADASYNWSNQSGKDSTGKEVLNGNSWGIGATLFPGIAYRISKHFFLELSIPSLISIRYYKSNTTDQYSAPPSVQTSKSDQLFIGSSLSSNPLDALGIGFRLIL
jgi:hypothetical protein